MDLKPAEVNEFMTQWEIDYLCGDKTTAPEREKILTANRAALVGRSMFHPQSDFDTINHKSLI